MDALRITLRLSTRLSMLSHKGYEGLSRDLDEIGRMLGGWLKQSALVSAETIEARSGIPEAPAQRSRGGVRYRMTSPQVERYLRAKLENPQETVFVKSGAFLLTFFEDAVGCGQRLGVAVRDLAATDEPERIPLAGFRSPPWRNIGVATDSLSTLQNPGESRFRENRVMILHLAH